MLAAFLTFRKRDFFEKTEHNVAASEIEITDLEDPNEGLSRGQKEEIDRVYLAYPHLNDDEFVKQHRDEWLR